MTPSIILRPLGGVSGVQRRHYTARDKIAIISQICHFKQDTGVSYWASAVSIGVSHTLVVRWHALCEHFSNLNISSSPTILVMMALVVNLRK
jgi:hypothetical protein